MKNDKINDLDNQLKDLVQRQNNFVQELKNLKTEINFYKETKTTKTIEVPFEPIKNTFSNSLQQVKYSLPKVELPKIKISFEKFIGENLINKIGIIILIIGVLIGTKYSIENNLISPLTRIILGYITSLLLLVLAKRLKTNYNNYSAVLVSGGFAIMYLITYLAYNLYYLFSIELSFILMIVFTFFAVITSLKYDKQIIALLGLVGAYAIPFLLNDSSENSIVFLSYIVIINIGILIIAFKKYWKALYYTSFGVSWLIYSSWYVNLINHESNFTTSFIFLNVIFITFLATSIAYKTIKKKTFDNSDIILLLLNAFIYYALGYKLFSSHEIGNNLLGLFTLSNALLYFTISIILNKKQILDKTFIKFIIGLAITFFTIAIPVQLNNNWIVLLWTSEAVLLFFIGRTKKNITYEKIAYTIIYLACIALFDYWFKNYNIHLSNNVTEQLFPLINKLFSTSIYCVLGFGIINYINKKYRSLIEDENLSKLLQNSIVILFLMIIYFTFYFEINQYWNQKYMNSFNDIRIISLKKLWLINYTIFFSSLLGFINLKKIKSKSLAYSNLIMILISVLFFLTIGQKTINSLLNKSIIINQILYVKYISYILISLSILISYKYIHQKYIDLNLTMAFDFFMHITTLAILSNELINILNITNTSLSVKLSISILWGVYSLTLVSIGIWKEKQYLRLAALVLFGITLVKLFLYDINYLTTLSKTIVFIILGILLLVISFIYNKYKQKLITPKNEIG